MTAPNINNHFMLENIVVALFKGFFTLLGMILKGIGVLIKELFKMGVEASKRKSRAIYASPEKIPSSPTPPSIPTEEQTTATEEAPALQLDYDPLFEEIDALLNSGQYTEAMQLLDVISQSGQRTANYEVNLAGCYYVLWHGWSESWPEPDEKMFPDLDQKWAEKRSRAQALREPLQKGCAEIDAFLSTNQDGEDAITVARLIHGELAKWAWAWRADKEGYMHQRRFIELSPPPIDYDALDLARRLATHSQMFGDYFDLTEKLFVEGRVTPDCHYHAAVSAEGAVNDEKHPLSPTDQQRVPEFLRAALAHLEYMERHHLETGLHWHNAMAQVLASMGDIAEAKRHFQIFKDLASEEEHGEAMLSMFGNPTVKIINHYIDQQR